jgi:hypothetical protein
LFDEGVHFGSGKVDVGRVDHGLDSF